MPNQNRRFPPAPFAVLSALAALLAPAARAQSMQDMPALPTVSLPAEPTVPTLWGSVSALQLRMVDPVSAAHLANVESDVNGSLATLASSPASLGDDALASLAKEAALLQALALTPPAGSAFSTYRDAATTALVNIGPRSSNTITVIPPSCGGGTIDILQDSPHLQSMAEAYDLLRGSGVDAATDQTIRALIDQWGNAIAGDCNLDALGVYPHKDNWGLKGASALITASLVLASGSTLSDAQSWFSFANSLLAASIQNVGASAGWYREGAHYLNYALDDLFSAAVQIENSTGVDWVTPLKPFAQAALALRQPDGTEAPFEDGIPCVFPFDVFAPYYPDIGGELVWAFNNSNQNTDSYPLQQPVEATRYLAGEPPAATAPAGRPSQFVGGDAHISALRSGWDANALQATLFAARDFEDESSSLISSYHDTNNPLDLVIAADGQTLLPTSGGGPEITNSYHRAYYLAPYSKNLPLLNGSAPWVTDGTKIASDLQLAGQDELGLSGRYLELSRATFTGAYSAPATAVARTVALVGGQYVALVDEIDAQAGQGANVTLGVALHGRGTRTLGAQTGSPLGVTWNYQGATGPLLALDAFIVGSTALTMDSTSAETNGYYAATYSGSNSDPTTETSEERIQAVFVNGTGSATKNTVRAITVLAPREASALPITVTDRTQANGAQGELPGLLAVQVQQGANIDHLASAPEPYVLEADGGVALSDAGLEVTNIDGVATDAIFSAVRENAAGMVGFGVGQATTLSFNGQPVLVTGTPLTVSFDASPALDGGSLAAGYIGEISADTQGISSFSVHGLAGYDPGAPYSATYREQSIVAPNFVQLPDGFQFGALSGGGTIAVAPAGPEILAPIPPHTVAEGQPLSFTLPFTAPAGVTLAFSYTSATTFPAGSAPVLNPSTGAFTWTPAYDTVTAPGPATVVIDFTASGGGLSVSRAAAITVTFVDRGPTLQPIPNAVVRRDSNYSLQLVGSDPDGLPITYGYQPEHAFPSPAPSFDPVHGTFSWNCPSTAPLGANEITFSASDGTVTVTQSMNLEVQDVNHPPVFYSINGVPLADPTMDTIAATTGQLLTLAIVATDADDDPITYSARQARGDLPDGATFSAAGSTATFTWTPTAVGSTTIIFHADDDYGGDAELQLTINVADASGCASGGAPGAFAMLLGILLVLRARRRVRTA